MKLSVIPYILIISFLLTFSFISCQSATNLNVLQAPSYEIFTGIIRYPGNLYFPSRVRLVITLNQINPFDDSSIIIISQTINNPQKFPVNYTLRYLKEEIDTTQLFRLSYYLYNEGEDVPYLFALSNKVKQSDLKTPIDITLKELPR